MLIGRHQVAIKEEQRKNIRTGTPRIRIDEAIVEVHNVASTSLITGYL